MNPSLVEQVAALIKAARLRQGYTQHDLAIACGWIARNQICRIENGRCVTLPNLDVLARALKVPLHSLIPGRCE